VGRTGKKGGWKTQPLPGFEGVSGRKSGTVLLSSMGGAGKAVEMAVKTTLNLGHALSGSDSFTALGGDSLSASRVVRAMEGEERRGAKRQAEKAHLWVIDVNRR
jgi:hypothetical protein